MKKRKNKVLEVIDNNNLGSMARTFLSSIIVILIFYSLPLLINFTNENILNSNEFRNNSKKVLAYTLDKKLNGSLDINETFDERDLLVDIYSLNEKETESVDGIIVADVLKKSKAVIDYESNKLYLKIKI